MSFESLMNKCQELNRSVEALAALGAELRLRQNGLGSDSRVPSLLQDVVHCIEPGLLDGLEPSQELAVLALIQAFFSQANDLLENPGRDPGWSCEDPVILESQGQVSRLIVRSIDTLAAKRPALGATLQQPGAFLDVGTGVGWLAIEAARSWPALRIVGIDSWEAALTLARKNLAQSGVSERVELRSQRVEQLDDEKIFTLAWLPGPFIAVELMALALERIYRALAPAGWLIIGLYRQPSDKLGQALTNCELSEVVVIRGQQRSSRTGSRRLGFDRIEALSPSPSIMFLMGQRPAVPR